MTLQECYDAMGSDYGDVLSRLRSERLVQKFVLKFLDDPSFDLLCNSIEAGQWEDAFRASHTLKGVCQNLGFTKLGQSSSELTEALRGGHAPQDGSLLEQVKADYALTADAIRTNLAGAEPPHEHHPLRRMSTGG